MRFNSQTLTSVLHLAIAGASALMAAGVIHTSPETLAAIIAIANAISGGKDAAKSTNGSTH